MTNARTHKPLMDSLGQHYSALLRQHGDSPAAVQYSDRETQRLRFKYLVEMGIPKEATVLDFGCGTADLASYLEEEHDFRGKYVGYDICPDMITTAQNKFSKHRFENRNIFASPPNEKFDYILISGVFNNAVEFGDNTEFMRDTLRLLTPLSNCGLAFNALSTYVDYFDPGLVYFDPAEVLSFCKRELAARVTLRHDYLIKPSAPPFEFTVYVYSS
jgi:SAM-dependent methyltransferase